MTIQAPTHYQEIVDEHGRNVEDAITEGKVDVVEQDHIPSRSATSFRMTPSEDQALGWICEAFNIDIADIRRDSSGIDFIYGDVGFEIKSGAYYEFSQTQVEHAQMLKYLFLVKSNENGVKIIDLYDQPRLKALS